jgi:predicted alpha/beta hydrolase family esterase
MGNATKVLLIPGWHGSPEGHWQTIWERSGWRGATRIEQRDWVAAERAEWVRGVEDAVAGRVVLVAHSLGVLTVAHWAAESGKTGCVAGAFLVAPPDAESVATFPAALASFANVPMGRLPFPTLVAGSETDPYARLERVEEMARGWGARFVNVGAAGHVNVASGHGEWAEGKGLVEAFMVAVDGR